VLILFISCNSKQQGNTENKAKRDNSNNSLVDTLNYTTQNSIYIPLSDTMELDSPAYYLDTFSVSNNRFRIVHFLFNNPYDPILEKFINGQWFKQIEFRSFNGSGEIKHLLDINNDSYKDITYENRWFREIYFYDSIKNNFIDTAGADINDGFYLLDTTKNIYCDFDQGRGWCGHLHSKLYTIKNYTKTTLFDLELCNCSEKNEYVTFIKKLILSKCFERKLLFKGISDRDSLVNIETINLSKPINMEKEYEPYYSYFDYVSFWRKNYKRLMGYSQH
jgi:hypothetical protein